MRRLFDLDATDRSTLGRFIARGAIGVLLLGTLLACKKLKRSEAKPDETPKVSGPISFNWEHPYKLNVTGTQAEASFFATKDADKPPLKLQAYFNKFPKGSKVKIGSESNTIDDSWSTLVDIKSAILKQPLSDLKGPIDLDLDLSIEVPGAPAVTAKLPKQDVKESLRAALMKARDGGLSFGAGDEAAAKPRGAAVVSGYSDLDFVGAAKNVNEIDWVVIAENDKEPRATKTCQFKEGPVSLQLFDAKAVVVERRTGKQVAQKVIKASDQCPMFAYVDKTTNSTKNTVDQKDVVDFGRTELSKAK